MKTGVWRGSRHAPAKEGNPMPLNPNASIEITAFRWVPEFAQGVVRDLRARWALEEAGLDYRVRLLDQQRPLDYLKEQPFDQVPCFKDGTVAIFETGAIVQYIGEKTESLLPRDPQGKFRAIQWTYAALNSVEPAIFNILAIDIFYAGEEWAKLRRPGAVDFAKLKLKRVSDWLGDKQWLEGDRFTIGDLIMVTSLRFLRHTNLVPEFPNLAAYVKRGQARPAFQQALNDQLAAYAANQPQPEGAAA
jgi:glutathione S-transferase